MADLLAHESMEVDVFVVGATHVSRQEVCHVCRMAD